MTVQLHTLTFHTLAATPRREHLDGRPQLCVPVIPIVEGVLNGVLVRREEIGHFVGAWNDAPVPINHPTNADGLHISAKAPAIIQQHCIGRLYNCAMLDDRLKGELWVDTLKCQQMGGEALYCHQRLEQGHPMEVSTAYWSDDEYTSGEWRGTPYTMIAHAIRPDHLALLPHDIGACSWENGCGAPRTNAAKTCTCGGDCMTLHQAQTTLAAADLPEAEAAELGRGFWAFLRKFVTNSHLTRVHADTPDATPESPQEAAAPPTAAAPVAETAAPPADDTPDEEETPGEDEDAEPTAAQDANTVAANTTDADVREALASALAKERDADFSPLWLEAVEFSTDGSQDHWCIYRLGERLYRRMFTMGDDRLVQLSATIEDVQRDTTFLPTGDTAASDGGSMTGNTTAQEDMTVRKQQLVLALIANAATGWTDTDQTMLEAFDEPVLERMLQAAGTPVPPAEAAPVANTQAPPAPVSLTFEQLPPDVQAIVTAHQQQEAATKQRLIHQITSNARNAFTVEQLTAKGTAELQQLASMLGGIDYSALGLPAVHTNADQRITAPPSILLKKRELAAA